MAASFESRKAVTTTRPARYIRFSPEEYEQVMLDEERTGKSVQDLLKKAYFGGGPVVLLMTDQETGEMMAQIMRIGNNMNQIARQLNSGFGGDYNQPIVEARAMLTKVQAWLSAKYGPYRK